MHCIIPARGGSKRYPRKNLKHIKGKPVFYYPAMAAMHSGLFDEIVISTEDDEIAGIARSQGLKVDKRPDDLATDTASVAEVCREYLQRNNTPAFACLYSTACLIKPEHIREAAKKLETHTNVMGVTKYKIHPWKAMDINGNPLLPEDIKRPLNEAQEYYGSNGSLYMGRTEDFLRTPDFYNDVALIETPSIDVDYEEDFRELRQSMTA